MLRKTASRPWPVRSVALVRSSDIGRGKQANQGLGLMIAMHHVVVERSCEASSLAHNKRLCTTCTSQALNTRKTKEQKRFDIKQLHWRCYDGREVSIIICYVLAPFN